MTAPASRAVFLDRDGTVIEDLDYARDPDRVRLLPGAAAGLARLQAAGFQLVLVSNQSGIGRRIITPEQARAVHERLVAILAGEGIALQSVKYCPHAPWEGCDCRKPEPGMLIAASEELGLDLASSFMVGDKPSDVEAGRRAGCRAVLLCSDAPRYDGADHVARDWGDMLDFILGVGAAA